MVIKAQHMVDFFKFSASWMKVTSETGQNRTEHFIYTGNFFNYSELFSEKAVLKTITLIIKYVLYTNIYIEISYK